MLTILFKRYSWQYSKSLAIKSRWQSWKTSAFMTQGDCSLQARMLASLTCNWNHKPMCVKRTYSLTVLRIFVPCNLDFIHYLCKNCQIYRLIKLFTYFPHFITHYRWREYERFTREHTCKIVLLPWDFLNITSQKKKRQGIFLIYFSKLKKKFEFSGQFCLWVILCHF